MQITTTLKDYFQSELIKRGENEFINQDSDFGGKTQITDHNRKFAFIYKIMNYTDDVRAICVTEIFNDFKLPNDYADDYFNRMFLNQFLDRQINQQTIEAFASKCTTVKMQHMTELEVLCDDFKSYYDGHAIDYNNTDNGSNGANAVLPQDEVNLNLHEDTADFADNNTITRGFNHETKDHYDSDAEVFDKLRDSWRKVMRIFDRTCFLQIY